MAEPFKLNPANDAEGAWDEGLGVRCPCKSKKDFGTPLPPQNLDLNVVLLLVKFSVWGSEFSVKGFRESRFGDQVSRVAACGLAVQRNMI